MNNQLSTQHLRFFTTLYKEQNLSKACSQLGLSQPAGSRLLASLRETFQDELFLKTKSGMVPTERCHQRIAAAQNCLENLESLVKDEVFNPATLQKKFRLGLVDNAFFSIFLPCIKYIEQVAPGVTFEVPDIRFSFLAKFDYLAENEVDLLIYPYKFSSIPNHIRYVKLFEDHFVYITRKGHPLESIPQEKIHETVNNFPKVRVSSLKKFLFTDPSDIEDAAPTEHCYVKSPFFVSSAFACLVSDVVVVLPETTATTLAHWLPITVYKTQPLRENPFYPTLYWHESKQFDPANQWLRSIIISEAQKHNQSV